MPASTDDCHTPDYFTYRCGTLHSKSPTWYILSHVIRHKVANNITSRKLATNNDYNLICSMYLVLKKMT